MILDDLRDLERGKKVNLVHFNYSAIFPIATFVAAANLLVNIPVNNDSDFLWRFTMMTATSGAGVFLPAPDMLISFADTGSGKNLQDQPQHVLNVTGTAQLPFILPEPYLITAGSLLAVTMQNNAAGPAALVNLTISGFKVYYQNGYSR
jgi:hypothetical protein